MEKNSNEPIKEPLKPISLVYADAKQAIASQINRTMAAYRLPIFMAEGILSSILCDIRSNAINEMSDESERYAEELKEYYENQIEQAHNDLKDAIEQFENPENHSEGEEEITRRYTGEGRDE